MTVEKSIELARRFSRTTTSAITDVQTLDLLNEALDAFGKDAWGLIKEAYIYIEPRFNLSTTMAFKLTITGGTNALVATDIAVTDVSTNGMTGAQVATELQAQIRAAGPTTLTVTWSTSLWKFTISAIDSTAIAIADPEPIYASALANLGYGEDSGTTSLVSGVPEDCTVEADLPDDFLLLTTNPEWDKNEVCPAPVKWFESPQTSGTPQFFYIEKRKIRLTPPPIEQKLFHIRYRYTPAHITTLQGYQECGLTGKRGNTAPGLAAQAYKFKITVDGGTQEEITFTQGATLTFTAMIALINAALLASTYSSAATCSLVAGDLRFTSATTTSVSAISLAAGSSANLFAALMGFTALETAVASQAGDELDVEDEDVMAIPYYIAHLMAHGNFETEVSTANRQKYIEKIIYRNRVYATKNPKIRPTPVRNRYANENVEVKHS